MHHDKVIAIDGPSGAGKSTVAHELAGQLGWTYLDTGAMYRTVTLAWLETGAAAETFRDPVWLAGLRLDFEDQRISLNGRDVSVPIRSAEVTANASLVAAEPAVRHALTDTQRAIGRRKPCVLDGRDIGTVVFPHAFLKVFLEASPEVRAHRRWLQLGGPDSGTTVAAIVRDQRVRDAKDSGRDLAPLKKAEDAMAVDTDRLDADEVVAVILAEARRRLAEADSR